MKKPHKLGRALALLLACAMLAGLAPLSALGAGDTQPGQRELSFEPVEGIPSPRVDGAFSAPESEPEYMDDESVRVSIVLDEPSTFKAGYDLRRITVDSEAAAYREGLRSEQASVTNRIEAATGTDLDVVWNLTLAANTISANVPYGQIERIKSVPGVADVVIETRYAPAVVDESLPMDPNMSTSSDMIGSSAAWGSGYTGAGRRIAVIDTGIDDDHQSFSGEAYEYSLMQQTEGKNKEALDEYMKELNVLTVDEINEYIENNQLNIVGVDADKLHLSSKVPFAYNYIDGDYTVNHDSDTQSEHGSHVAGIAAANSYIPGETEGEFVTAIDSVYVQGVAPDAQLIVMKVFGKLGGAYESDYFAAVEDAIVMGCDSVNLSLGAALGGFSNGSGYQELLQELVGSGTVMVTSGGNAGAWADGAAGGAIYGDDVNFHTAGAPTTFTNTLSVASADNTGYTGKYVKLGDEIVFYNESTTYGNEPLSSVAGTHNFVYIDELGTVEQFTSVKDELQNAVAACNRGDSAFYEKAQAAVDNGAIAVIIVNNEPGMINMDLSDFKGDQPVVSFQQEDGAALKAAGTKKTAGEGDTAFEYYVGKIYVSDSVFHSQGDDTEHPTISTFSSWGVPGSLELKPEITAPGGNIYSVDGATPGGKSYENMSGTSMAAPQISGMTALVNQHIDEAGIKVDGFDRRAIAQSLLMSTAVPMKREDGSYYSVLQQGAGLANVGAAVNAGSCIIMNEDATASWADGKVKAELGSGDGTYSFSFTVRSINKKAARFTLSTDVFTQKLVERDGETWLSGETTTIPCEVTYRVNGAKATIVHVPPAGSVSVKVELKVDTDALKDYVNGAYVEGFTTLTPDYTPEGEVGVTHSIPFLGFCGNWSDPAMFDRSTYIESLYGQGKDAYAAPSETDGNKVYYDTGAITYNVPGSQNLWVFQGNPYGVEDDLDAVLEKAALSSAYKVNTFIYSLIRNAAALGLTATTESPSGDKSTVLMGYSTNVYAAYYSGGAWNNTYTSANVGVKVSTIAKEGDRVTFTATAVPELFLTQEQREAGLTPQEFEKIYSSGELGRGAKVSVSFLVDDTAPVIETVNRDLLSSNDKLDITVSENQNVAYAAVMSRNGATTYAEVLAPEKGADGKYSISLECEGRQIGSKCVVLVADYAGNETTCLVEYGGQDPDISGQLYGYMDGSTSGLNGWVLIDPEQVVFDKTTKGVTVLAEANVNVMAAAFAGDRVFYIGDNSTLYMTDIETFGDTAKVGTLSELTATSGSGWLAEDNILGMTYDSDKKLLYVLDSESTVWSIDPFTGADNKLFTVEAADCGPVVSMALDNDKGIFYGITEYSEGSYWAGTDEQLSKLVSWTLPDDTTDTVTAEVLMEELDYSIGTYALEVEELGGSLAWDEVHDKLYLSNSSSEYSDSAAYNILFVIDPVKCTCELANTSFGTYSSVLRQVVHGMFVIPEKITKFETTDEVDSVDIPDALDLMVTGTETLEVTVSPWTLKDRSVTWASSNPAVATVDENGVVKALSAGTATVTVTANADKSKQDTCTVTVSELPDIQLSALFTVEEGGADVNMDGVSDSQDAQAVLDYLTGSEAKIDTAAADVDGDGKISTYDAHLILAGETTHATSFWADYNVRTPDEWTIFAEGASRFTGGGMSTETELIASDGSHFYSLDPDTLEETDLGAAEYPMFDFTRVPTFAEIGYTGAFASYDVGGSIMKLFDPSDINSNLYWNPYNVFTDNAAIAAVTYYKSESGWSGSTDYLYLITTNGELWSVSASGTSMFPSFLGEIKGLDLRGAATEGSDCTASMEYDETSGLIVLTSFIKGKDTGSKVRLIDPEAGNPRIVAEQSFSDGVYVTVNYHHERETDLAVKVKETSAFLLQGDTTTFTARVINDPENLGLKWSSSDENVATVDENGVVTGKADGTATITAETVAVNKEGNTVKVEFTVKVAGVKTLDTEAELRAQLTDAEGKVSWVSIPLSDVLDADKRSDLGTSIAGKVPVTLTGGGVGDDGKVYGGDVKFGEDDKGIYYVIDPDDGYKAQPGARLYSNYAPVDLTQCPEMEVTMGGATETMFGGTIRIGYDGRMFMSQSPTSSMLSGWDAAAESPAAIAYGGEGYSYSLLDDKYDYSRHYSLSQTFYVLESDGTLDMAIVTPSVGKIDGEVFSTSYLNNAELTNIGVTFPDRTAMSMDAVDLDGDGKINGLVVADSGTGAVRLLYIDIENDYEVTYLGVLPGAVDLTAVSVTTSAEGASTDSLTELPEGAVMKWGGELQSYTFDDGGSAVSSVQANDKEFSFTGAPRAAAQSGEGETGKAPVELAGIVVDKKSGTAKLTLNAVGVTNGLANVTYDPSVLTFKEANEKTQFISCTSGSGSVKVAFASAADIDGAVVELVFTFNTSAKIDTDITVSMSENGKDLSAGLSKSLQVKTGSSGSHIGGGVAPAPGPSQDTKPEDEPSEPSQGSIVDRFTDVDKSLWYMDGINYVVENGLMQGTGETTFSPNELTTRGMVVTILYRLAGKPQAGDSSFPDVADGEWYSDAIDWAVENGIMTGYNDTQFGPADPITREQIAAVLYRYAVYKNMDVSASADLSGFADAGNVSDWALTAMRWAAGTNLIKGTGSGLSPAGKASRAETATLLMRFCQGAE